MTRTAILAGGHASRFGGGPKGLERVGGERILDRLLAVIHEATGELPLLVAGHVGAKRWHPPLTVVPDVMPDCGSLGGIYTALVSGEGPVLVVAWDMPFLTADLLRALIEGAQSYDAFLPASDGRRGVEPLCAVYGPACRDIIRQSLEEEDYRVTGFLDRVNMGTLPKERVAQLGDLTTLFFNVNTPDDLARAQELAGGARPPRRRTTEARRPAPPPNP